MKAQNLFVVATAALMAMTSAQASVEISANPTKNMHCISGVCAPRAPNAVLNATDLASMLAAGDVKVMTGNGAVTITVLSSFSWTSSSRLTLDAIQDVSFGAPVDVTGPGAVTIMTNDGGTGGDLIFLDGGKLDFWELGSSLIVNGNSYALAGDIATLAGDIAANPSGFYALAKDYDATPDGTYANAPIKTFAGTFEGLGNAVSNLTIADVRGKDVKNAALFAISSGTIRDIGVLNANITVGGKHGNYAGALVGQNMGTISRAFATSSVVYGDYGRGTTLGGLVAVNKGTILLSHSDSTVELGGGLVGENDGLISGCYSSGSVNGDPKFATIGGGLAGTNSAGATITLSHSDATVSGGFSAGGLLGFNNGVVTLSYAEGHVSGSGELGGLIGGVSEFNGGSVANVYSTSTVAGNRETATGGLIGESGEKTFISFAYATGAVSSQQEDFRGGVLGADYSDPATFASAYWDLTTTGVSDKSKGDGTVPDKPGIQGLKDAQLKAKLPAGFDPAIWGQKKTINNGYPYLLANPPQ